MFSRPIWSSIRVFFCLILTMILAVGPSVTYAQGVFVSTLPEPGTMLGVSEAFTPVVLKGMVIHPEDPLKFDFLMDTGTSRASGEDLRKEAENSIKYFLTSLTIPEDDLWVNLSPYEKDRVIPDAFGKTVMGRDLLAEDYVLKQLASSLLYPENSLGQEFWSKIYETASRELGTTDIDVNNFSRVWIVPSEAQVWEHDGKVVILKSHLKVMLEEDYLALEKSGQAKSSLDTRLTRIYRDVMVPAIEKEVNEGTNFARLRQVYAAMILSTWYKIRLKEGLLAKAYADKSKTLGVEFTDSLNKDEIYSRYLETVKKGVFNYIREENDPVTGETVPRKYFSGGFIGKTLPVILSVAVGAFTQLAVIDRDAVAQTSQPVGDTVLVGAGVTQIESTIAEDAARLDMEVMIQAVLDGNIERVKRLLDSKVNVNGVFVKDGSTALMNAAHSGQKEIAELLIARGADVNAKIGGNLLNGSTALKFASLEGRANVVELLLAKGADVNAKDVDEWTALMAASLTGHVGVVKLLLAKGADVNAKNVEGSTALIKALYRGKREIADLLIAKGADMNAKENNGATVLTGASASGYADIVERQIKSGADVNVREADGSTALMWAAEGGHKKVVELLIAKGAEINAKTNSGKTALMGAVSREQKEIVRLLLSKGANIQAITTNGMTAFSIARMNGFQEIYKILESKGLKEGALEIEQRTIDDMVMAAVRGDLKAVKAAFKPQFDVNGFHSRHAVTALMAAAQEGNKDVVAFLLTKGANANLRDNNGATALMLATEKDRKEVIDLLLAKGADVNVTGNEGAAALFMAAQNGNKAIVELLLANGSDVSSRLNDGSSALSIAAQEGHKDIVKLLISSKADVNVKRINGVTPLMTAAANGHKEVVEQLLLNGADISAKSKGGTTALIYAAEEGRKEVVELLIEKGADINAKMMDNGGTSLMTAAQRGHKEVVALLISKGADVNARANRGETALIVVSEEGYREIVELLIAKGANVNAVSNSGLTALMLSGQNGHKDVVQLLITKGANVDTKAKDGRTALGMAIKAQRVEVVRILEAAGAKDSGDKAMSLTSTVRDLGGIDLDAKKLNLQIKRDGEGVALPIDQQDWSKINIQGFLPVIYHIEPVNMSMLLGLNVSDVRVESSET